MAKPTYQDMLTEMFGLQRFGIKLVGSVKHADVLLVSGIVLVLLVAVPVILWVWPL